MSDPATWTDIANMTLFNFWIMFMMPVMGGIMLTLSIRIWWVKHIDPFPLIATLGSLLWLIISLSLIANKVG